MFKDNPKVLLHIIMPNQISGPNTQARLISNSYLSNKYSFNFLVQRNHAGGKISISLIKALKKQIEEFDPDIIHLSGLLSPAFHAVIAARICGKKNILLAIRGSSADSLTISLFKKLVFSKIIEPLTLKLSHSVYTVCDAMAQRGFVKKYSTRFLGTIHNSAPIIDKTLLLKSNFRSTNKLKPDTKLVAIVGRMVYDKGISFIVNAIKQINNENIIFLFIGDGTDLLEVKKEFNDKISKNKVFLLGKQNDVLSLLSECDIFLFASLHENLSNALLEACSLGLAVIATNVGGNPEVIKNKENGILIPPKNSTEIVNAVNLLVENNNLRKKYGQKAKEFVEDNFSQTLLLGKLDEVYSDLL